MSKNKFQNKHNVRILMFTKVMKNKEKGLAIVKGGIAKMQAQNKTLFLKVAHGKQVAREIELLQ
jgi:hypothetical protein